MFTKYREFLDLNTSRSNTVCHGQLEISSNTSSESSDRKIEHGNLIVNVPPYSNFSSETSDDFSTLKKVKDDIETIWEKIETQSKDNILKIIPNNSNKQNVKKETFKIVRLFVSSTFIDFHSEREILVKKTFPILREWCEKRHLRLVECDLRWGVPRDSTTRTTLLTCFEELDRCHQTQNNRPIFLNLTGDRYGWVPTRDDIPDDIRDTYQWIDGASVTLMEVLHGAFRTKNPNALFLVRKSSFINEIPENVNHRFSEKDIFKKEQITTLKRKLKERFPEQVFEYTVKIDNIDPETNRISLRNLDEFSEKVLEFFKNRLEKIYSRDEMLNVKIGHSEQEKEIQRLFIEEKGNLVFGRNKELDLLFNNNEDDLQYNLTKHNNEENLLKDFSCEDDDNKIIFVLSDPGIGKSALLAKFVKKVEKRDEELNIFYHFVPASVWARDDMNLLKNLVEFFIKPTNDDCKNNDYENIMEKLNSRLLKDVMKLLLSYIRKYKIKKKSYIVIDALNEMRSAEYQNHLDWLPPSFPKNVTCIVSANSVHIPTLSRINDRNPKVLHLNPLDRDGVLNTIEYYLGTFNKKLDSIQKKQLAENKSAPIPLWLRLACEELRVHGEFHTVTEKILSFPDNLPNLIESIFSRLQLESTDINREALNSTLCLLYVSTAGLAEEDLPTMLGTSNNPIAPLIWAATRRVLKPFIKTTTVPSIGSERIDFIHDSVKQAVRLILLKDSSSIIRWHYKMAEFLLEHANKENVIIEEIPYQLEAAGQRKKLLNFFRTNQLSAKLPRYIRVKYMNAIRCKHHALINNSTEKKKPQLLYCIQCAFKVGLLSFRNTDSCYFCGNWTPPMNRKDTVLCTFHSHSNNTRCLLCNNIVFVNGPNVYPAFICHMCTNGPMSYACCILKDNDDRVL